MDAKAQKALDKVAGFLNRGSFNTKAKQYLDDESGRRFWKTELRSIGEVEKDGICVSTDGGIFAHSRLRTHFGDEYVRFVFLPNILPDDEKYIGHFGYLLKDGENYGMLARSEKLILINPKPEFTNVASLLTSPQVVNAYTEILGVPEGSLEKVLWMKGDIQEDYKYDKKCVPIYGGSPRVFLNQVQIT